MVKDFLSTPFRTIVGELSNLVQGSPLAKPIRERRPSAPEGTINTPVSSSPHSISHRKRASEPNAGEFPRSPRSPKRPRRDLQEFPDYESGFDQVHVVRDSPPPPPKVMIKSKHDLGGFKPRNTLNWHSAHEQPHHNAGKRKRGELHSPYRHNDPSPRRAPSFSISGSRKAPRFSEALQHSASPSHPRRVDEGRAGYSLTPRPPRQEHEHSAPRGTLPRYDSRSLSQHEYNKVEALFRPSTSRKSNKKQPAFYFTGSSRADFADSQDQPEVPLKASTLRLRRNSSETKAVAADAAAPQRRKSPPGLRSPTEATSNSLNPLPKMSQKDRHPLTATVEIDAGSQHVGSRYFPVDMSNDEPNTLRKDSKAYARRTSRHIHDSPSLRGKLNREVPNDVFDPDSTDELAQSPAAGGFDVEVEPQPQLGSRKSRRKAEKNDSHIVESDSDAAPAADIKPTVFTRSGQPEVCIPQNTAFRKDVETFDLRTAYLDGNLVDKIDYVEVPSGRSYPYLFIHSANKEPERIPLMSFSTGVFSTDGNRVHFLTRKSEGKPDVWCHLEFYNKGSVEAFKQLIRRNFGLGLGLEFLNKVDRELREMLERKLERKSTGKAAKTFRDPPTPPAKIEAKPPTAQTQGMNELDRESSPQPPKREKLVARMKDEQGKASDIPTKEKQKQSWTAKFRAPPILKPRVDPDPIIYDPPSGDELSEVKIRKTRTSLRTAGRSSARQSPIDLDLPEKYSKVHGFGKPWIHPLVYPAKGTNKATVEFGDLERLDDGEFLNDNLISFYLRYLQEEYGASGSKVYFFNTYFYETLTKPAKGSRGINYEAVKRWTAKINLFDYDYIVVPINESLHWHAAIMCNVKRMLQVDAIEVSDDEADPLGTDIGDRPTTPKNTPNGNALRSDQAVSSAVKPLVKGCSDLSLDAEKKLQPEVEVIQSPHSPGSRANRDEIEPQVGSANKADQEKSAKRKSAVMSWPAHTPAIISFDSFGSTHGPVIRNLKDYMQEEAQAKLDKDIVFVQGVTAKGIPLQQNFCDCGLFLLGYVAKFLVEPKEFVARILGRDMNETLDWPDFAPGEMRARMRETIMHEHEKQQQPKVHSASKKPESESKDDLGRRPQPDALEQLTGTPSKPRPKPPTLEHYDNHDLQVGNESKGSAPIRQEQVSLEEEEGVNRDAGALQPRKQSPGLVVNDREMLDQPDQARRAGGANDRHAGPTTPDNVQGGNLRHRRRQQNSSEGELEMKEQGPTNEKTSVFHHKMLPYGTDAPRPPTRGK